MSVGNISKSDNHTSFSSIVHTIIDPITKLFWLFINGLLNRSSKVEKEPIVLTSEQQRKNYLDENFKYIGFELKEYEKLREVFYEQALSPESNSIWSIWQNPEHTGGTEPRVLSSLNMNLNAELRKIYHEVYVIESIVQKYTQSKQAARQSAGLGDSDTESSKSETDSQKLGDTSTRSSTSTLQQETSQRVPPLPSTYSPPDEVIRPKRDVSADGIRSRYYAYINEHALERKLCRNYRFIDVSHILPPPPPTPKPKSPERIFVWPPVDAF